MTPRLRILTIDSLTLTKKIDGIEDFMKTMTSTMPYLASSINELNNLGRFPSDIKINPKENCFAIVTKSGNTYADPKLEVAKFDSFETEPKLA